MAAPFRTLTTSSFTDLCQRGFKVEAADDHSVTFARGDLRVVVQREPATAEVSLRVARGDELFSMSELIRVSDAAAGAAYRDRIARTDDALAPILTDLADLLGKYGQSLLDGDELAVPRLAKQQRRLARDLELRSKAAGMLQRANAAFEAKDYTLAAKLFGEVEPLLTKVQRAKLVVAKERSGAAEPS